MKKSINLTILFLSLVFLSACGAPAAQQVSPLNSAPAITPSTSPNVASKIVSKDVVIQNFSFSPAVLTIKKGTNVTWVNNDPMPHQIKADNFNSDLLSTGQTYSFIFNEVGTFNYICSVHPTMTGTIIVE